jgi:integrase
MATRILPEASGASVDDRVRAVVRTLLGAADMSALLAEGEDIRVIQVILGHRSLASTQVYTLVEPGAASGAVAAIDHPLTGDDR